MKDRPDSIFTCSVRYFTFFLFISVSSCFGPIKLFIKYGRRQHNMHRYNTTSAKTSKEATINRMQRMNGCFVWIVWNQRLYNVVNYATNKTMIRQRPLQDKRDWQSLKTISCWWMRHGIGAVKQTMVLHRRCVQKLRPFPPQNLARPPCLCIAKYLTSYANLK